jgi:iron(III) transport system permease protein
MNQRHVLLPLSAVLILVGFIVASLVFLFLFSLREGTPWDPGPYTLQHYVAVYSTPATCTVFFNTAVVAAASTAISLVIAMVFAFLTERTDMPFRNLAWGLMLVPIAVPGLLFAISWTFLLSPKIGLFNLWLRELFSVFGVEWNEGPLNL